MKRIKTVLLAVMLVLLSVAFCGCKEQEQTIPLPDVQVGEEFEITVRATAGRPYYWEYQITPMEGVDCIGSVYVPRDNNPDIIGGGTRIFSFQATKAGCYKIQLIAKHVVDDDKIWLKYLYILNVIEME